MTLPVIVTRLGKGSELTFAELDANFTNLRDGFNTVYSGISGDITVTSGGVASLSAGVISNADINAAAAIAYSKLAPLPAGQVILGSAGEVPTATSISGDISLDSSGNAAIAAGAIVDADINAGAQIAHSKLANLASGQLLIGSAGSVPTATALSGDVTVNSSGVTAITAGSIVNADISGSAAIAFSKLQSLGSGQILVGDAGSVPTAVSMSGDVTIAHSGLTAITAGAIVNADINSAAGISFSKMEPVPPGQILIGGLGSVATPATLSGDITVNGSGVAAISSGVIVNADINSSAGIAHSKLQSMAPGTVLIGGAGSTPTATTLSGAITVNSSGVTTLAAGSITDDKLATISTSGKVANSATTATSSNVANSIVARDAYGDIEISSINGGPLSGFRNAVINGNFDIWTRGTSFTFASSFIYTADRWVYSGDGSGTRSVSRQPVPLGTVFPGNPEWFLRINQTTGGSGTTFTALRQRIEGVRTFEGLTVSLSFLARSTTSSAFSSVRLTQKMGSGGTPSSNVTHQFVGSLPLTSTWTLYSYTLTMSSLSGKTLGTNGDDHLELSFGTPSNSTWEFDLACVQLEAGANSTPFEIRPLQAEQALCQRYYYGPLYPRSYIGSATGNANIYINFPVEMRAVPSVSYVIGVGSSFGFTGTTQGMNIVATVGGGGPDNYRIGLDDLYFDAEF